MAIASAVVTCSAAAVVIALRPVRHRAALVLSVIAPASASVSVLHAHRYGDGAGAWAYMETLALLLMVILVVRNTPVRRAVAAGLVSGLAESLLILRVVPASSLLEAAGLCAFWGLGAAGAVVIGMHLRWLDSERVRSVVGARRAQRLNLARDLHDFIAHDLGEMVIHAQVGQVASGRERKALRHIELTGQRALAALSATVGALHELDDSAATDEGIPGLGDLPRIVEDFAALGTVPATLQLEPGLAERLPRRLSTTLARIVIESLSNVRRHAPDAGSVEVKVVGTGTNVTTSVVNGPGSGTPAHTSTTRLGLSALEERVRSLGGRFAAAPLACGGWRVVAEIPVDTLLPDD
ncbi:hypothetical protein HS041_02240 [Planomonospora sp. ID67723]|uniref:sensor histidine kinase n=1 Tax=Planomonospora sp. ID67723 TaxID=2738134 RepID=UPI0018C36B34|nr:hypothetical protein [Planomonospora sp. ID67723]MBG0826595.1 hypothetical protein [Planomonospora sp. ID67723]